jgi:hypothetical protein
MAGQAEKQSLQESTFTVGSWPRRAPRPAGGAPKLTLAWSLDHLGRLQHDLACNSNAKRLRGLEIDLTQRGRQD